MATGGLYGSTSTGTVAPQSGSESVGLYGNNTVFGGTYFEWFIFKEAATQPATPTGGSWNFTTNVGTAPTGWLSVPPAVPSNQVWVSIGVVNSRSTAAITWSAPGLFTFGSGTVTSVAALTLGTSGFDVSSTVANPTTTPVITLNLPTASASNRGLLSSADWTAFNAKQPAGTYVTSVAATVPSFLSISGSPITTSGTLAIGYSGTALPVANGGTGAVTLTGYVYGNGTGAMTAATTIPTTVLSGTVSNAQLANNSITINGNVVSLGGSTTITSATISTLTIGTGLSGTSFNGATPVTIALASGYGDTLNPYASKTANYVLAAPNGSAGVPTFRAIVAADIPTLNQNTTGTAANVTGTVAVANGGTGATTAGAALTNLGAIGSVASADGSIVVTTVGTAVDLSVSTSSPASVLLEQVRNTTGATLTKGTAVYISGATGQIPTVSKALATSDATSAQTLGLITSDLPNNSNGYVTIIGLVTNLNTSAYTDGQQLYLSPTTAGTLTATKPYAPQHLVYVAVVSHAHPTQGKLIVKVQNGYELDEIHNVSAQSPVTGQTIVYNSGTSLWEKNTVSLTAGINGTLPVANGGTGQTTASAAFNALSPVTTTGDLIIGNGTNSATRLGIGANNYVLTSNGTTATWAAATGGVTQIIAGTNVTISPAGGTGAVTINASGGGGSSAYSRTTFTATAGQTAFTVTYAVGYLQIYVNGVLLTGSDYTATSGTGFTLAIACAAGDIVEALVITTSIGTSGITTGKSIAMALIFGY
tara:strand:- start:560 stop:2851 length:2292 start_codon:yes stop_codon:yes gene_type:complete